MNAFVLLCLTLAASCAAADYSSTAASGGGSTTAASTTTKAATTAAATTAASVASTSVAAATSTLAPAHPACDKFQNGQQCGCDSGNCWTYLNPAGNIKPFSDTDPWCYTSPLGSPANSGVCWPCKVYADCNWQAPCINSGTAQNAQHVGNDTIGPTGCASSKPY